MLPLPEPTPAAPPSKKAARRSFNVALVAAQLHVQRDCEPLPFVKIEGRAAPGPFADNGSPKPSEIRRWTRFVARDMGNQFPDDSEAAREFAFRHSLSIANAFHRRLMRADVTAELTRLFDASKSLSK